MRIQYRKLPIGPGLLTECFPITQNGCSSLAEHTEAFKNQCRQAGDVSAKVYIGELFEGFCFNSRKSTLRHLS